MLGLEARVVESLPEENSRSWRGGHRLVHRTSHTTDTTPNTNTDNAGEADERLRRPRRQAVCVRAALDPKFIQHRRRLTLRLPGPRLWPRLGAGTSACIRPYFPPNHTLPNHITHTLPHTSHRVWSSTPPFPTPTPKPSRPLSRPPSSSSTTARASSTSSWPPCCRAWGPAPLRGWSAVRTRARFPERNGNGPLSTSPLHPTNGMGEWTPQVSRPHHIPHPHAHTQAHTPWPSASHPPPHRHRHRPPTPPPAVSPRTSA